MHKLLKLLILSLLACSVFLTGCGSSVPVVKPFKMDIQQGNVVTSKMLLQLKPGMTKSQVKFIMGTPLIVDSFHSNRWDYFYQLRQAGKIKEQRRVILDFESELLARVRGDVVPEGTAGAASGAASGGEAGAVTLPKSIEPKSIELKSNVPKPKEKGLIDKLKFWKKDAKPAEANPAPKPELKEVAPVPALIIETPTNEGLEGSNNVPSDDIPTEDIPSVLAVPIEIKPARDLPAPEVIKIAPPALDVPKTEPVIIKPSKSAPTKLKEPLSDAKKATPAKPATKPLTKEEPLSLKIDRSLEVAPAEVAPVVVAPAAEVAPAEAAPAVKPKKVDVPPPPPEEEPGYFEKMLEKIGF